MARADRRLWGRANEYTHRARFVTLTGCCQVTTTLPDREVAQNLARRLVEERLAACAQVEGPVASVYRWKGAVESATEWY